MTYDNYGNIATKNGVAYTYGDGVWKDKLTAYGDKTITYDTQGNPLNYLGHYLTWEKGRQLASFDGNSYTYNANGIRTGKTVNGITHTYTLDGTKILRETWDDNKIIPLYDNEDSVCGIQYNSEAYYFHKNLQGDVIEIVDDDAKTVARYTYDAWGACTIIQDSSDCNIATINPYRYRGYYYDTEISMYYLQSRYYDSKIGKFLNSDDSIYMVDNQYDFNHLFAYCSNNPICRVDESGRFWVTVISPWSTYYKKCANHYQYNRTQSRKIKGYIYDQKREPASNLWFGSFRSSHNGCGWIATYNATIMLGNRIEPCDIIREFELTGAVLFGALGVQPYAIASFFRTRGYRVTITYSSSKFDSVAKKNKANIIFYWHKKGAHNVALRWSGKVFYGYNTYSGRLSATNWKSSISGYMDLKNYKAGMLISISKK